MMFARVVEDVGRAIEAFGVVVIAGSAGWALARFAVTLAQRGDGGTAYRRVRRDVGQGILLGLEVLVAGDIIRTVAVDPSLASVAVLGVIVLVRTFLSITIDTEVNGTWPWKRPHPPEGTALVPTSPLTADRPSGR